MQRCGTRARLFVGAFAIGALLASGCGSDSTSKVNGFRVATVARSTTGAGTARFAGTATVGSSSDKPLVTTFEGDIDFTRDRRSFMTHAIADGKRLDGRALFIGDFIYLSPPDTTVDGPEQTTRVVPDTTGKQWTRSLDPGLSSEFQLDDAGDATKLLSSLERGGWENERIGTEEVRGDTTEHYRFSLEGPPAPPKQLQQFSVGKAGGRVLEVWVDAQDRLRRLSESFQGSRYSSKFEIEFFDFGVPVTIEEPPADEVAIDDSNEPTSDWLVVQHGRAGDVDWAVYRATTKSGVCFSHSSATLGRSSSPEHERSREMCSIQTLTPPTGTPIRIEDLNTHAVALPNGMALLYGAVNPAIERLTLHISGGRTEHAVPADGTFAIPLDNDEVVDEIVLQTADQKIRCPTVKSYPDYACDISVRTVTVEPPRDVPPGATVPTTLGP